MIKPGAIAYDDIHHLHPGLMGATHEAVKD